VSATNRAWAIARKLEADNPIFEPVLAIIRVSEQQLHTSEKDFEHLMCEVVLGIRRYKLTVNVNCQRLTVEVESEMVLFSIHSKR